MSSSTKAKKPSIFAKAGSYIKETRSELKKVVWPSAKQVRNNTTIVIVSIIISGAAIMGIDWVFARFIDFLINLIR